MKIIGANLPRTQAGMPLNDGGLCYIDTEKGDVLIIAEERITRKKYDGGFVSSLYECLKRKKINISDIDYFVFSSCCENIIENLNMEEMGIPVEKTFYIPSHHLSHAYSTYFTSNFDEAIIMVLDNEGNIIENYDEGVYYKNTLEHMTYYVGKGTTIEYLERDNVAREEIGLGDAYRYFTHYLGFPSYVYAGKTMGLAPYGRAERFKGVKIFEFVDNQIKCNIRQNYFNPQQAIQEFFKQQDIEIVSPRTPIDEITQEHADLAYLIQHETEEILIQKVRYLVNKTGIKKLCIAGGVGLNCVVNSRLLNETDIEDIHIIPAAGDSGQCVGNALYALYKLLGQKKRLSINTAYLGFEYSELEVKNAIEKLKCKCEVEVFDNYKELNKKVAVLLSQGNIIARWSGKSEYGPRALGNRSILMDPRKAENKDILNSKVKFRESFRPFAPVALIRGYEKYFKIAQESPYMLLVAEVIQPNVIPAVTHVDLTARLQTVRPEQNEKLYDLIECFEHITGVPVLLNTSFNVDGEPIVESPEDAMRCYMNTNIDYLILENYLIKK